MKQEQQKQRRPRLTDPEEFAIIRGMYFDGLTPKEPSETKDRWEKRNKNKINQCR